MTKNPEQGGGQVTEITPQSEDFSRWYLDVVKKAELADYSPVKGCMVIRPYGYAIWELIQRQLDDRFKATGHVNAYFPLFIPESLIMKEAEHVEGFAPQVAWVTKGGTEDLEEKLIVRPTSETIFGVMYQKWIQSWRDLPVLINQWANVVRWELRTRLFLRTAEFLWQEGHTAHASEEEALEETRKMLDVYADFAETVMAMPVVKGRKTPGERFAGALDTMCIEAMMQDGKALQAGTSHYLGQNFSKGADVKFLNREGKLEYVYATSWGVSTRLVGALIMTHSDDVGLILPPKLAPIHVVIVPIYRKDDERARVIAEAEAVQKELRAQGLTVKLDDRDNLQPGAKYYEWEGKGVPLRIEIGPKDLEKGMLCLVRRFVADLAGESAEDQRKRKKSFVPRAEALASVRGILDGMQAELFVRAKTMQAARTRVIDNLADFERFFTQDGGGFAWVHWAGGPEHEDEMGKRFETTIRCIPLPDQIPEAARGEGVCILTGKPSAQRVVMAKAY